MSQDTESVVDVPPPTAHIQWKGTDVCLDLRCECGTSDFGHFDGYHAYAIECHACGRRYDLPDTIPLLPYTGRNVVVTSGSDDG